MTTIEAKELVDYAFNVISNSKTVEELKSFCSEKINISFNIELYPKIEFKISKEEIETLKFKEILTKENLFSSTLSSQIIDPLTKLLYSIAWKNGDLKKIRHIIEGITSVDKPITDKEAGLVFYQFGKYLRDKEIEPIVDQHILRAFAVSRIFDDAAIEKWRKKAIIGKEEASLICEYKEWLFGLTTEKNIPELGYNIDQFLFCLGRKIKMDKS